MKKWLGILLLFVLNFWAIHHMLIKGYFPMHDDTQIARVVVMGKALRQGQFPVRWVSDLGYGYGYPIYNFYAPLPYYIGGGFYAIGLNGVLSTKIMFLVGVLISGISMYLFLQPITGIYGALLGSVAFVYAPYHAVQIYIRGAVGEYWSIAFVPFIFLGYWYIGRKRFIQGIVVGGVGLACSITSHTILGFLITILTILGALFEIIYLRIISSTSKKYVLSFISAIFLGLSLSSFFWLPAFTEMKYTSVSSMISSSPTTFFDHFICIGQLWNSPWGYAGSAPGCINDGMSFKLGKTHIFLAIITFGLFIYQFWHQRNLRNKHVFAAGVVLLVFSILGTLPISEFFWRIFPFTQYIQYPWRLLAFSMVSIGIITGYLGILIQNTVYRYIAISIALCMIIGVNAKLFSPQYTYVRDAEAFETFQELRFHVSKISDEYLPSGVIKPTQSDEILKQPVEEVKDAVTTNITTTDTYLRANVRSMYGGVIRINRAYFPGWIYLVNMVRVQPLIVQGLPSIIVPPGKSIIEIRFINTQVRSIGNIISILALLALGGLLYYDSKNQA